MFAERIRLKVKEHEQQVEAKKQQEAAETKAPQMVDNSARMALPVPTFTAGGTRTRQTARKSTGRKPPRRPQNSTNGNRAPSVSASSDGSGCSGVGFMSTCDRIESE